MISTTPEIELNCPFYDSCKLSKMDSLCNEGIKFRVCPEFQFKRDKIK